MELEQVYWHFFIKFQDLNVPRSIVEARITGDEIEKLQSWFDGQYGRPRNMVRQDLAGKGRRDSYSIKSRDVRCFVPHSRL